MKCMGAVRRGAEATAPFDRQNVGMGLWHERRSRYDRGPNSNSA